MIGILVVSTTAMAQNPERGRRNQGQREFREHRQLQATRHFENFFTEEQQEAVRKIRLETAKEVKPLRNELNELRARQHTLTTAENADLDAINKNIEKMGSVRTEIQKIMAKQHQEIRSLLTEEQLLKFDARKGMAGKRPGRGEMDRGMHRGARFGRG